MDNLSDTQSIDKLNLYGELGDLSKKNGELGEVMKKRKKKRWSMFKFFLSGSLVAEAQTL